MDGPVDQEVTPEEEDDWQAKVPARYRQYEDAESFEKFSRTDEWW